MSVHVEWVQAPEVDVELVGPNALVIDERVDDGNHALIVGVDDLVVIEGTKAELVKLAESMVSLAWSIPDEATSPVAPVRQ